MVELDNDSLTCISIFEGITGARVKDCLILENGFAFIVEKGNLGQAIGKKGSAINRVRTAFRKPVYVFEDASTIEEFVKNLFIGVPIRNINIHEKMTDKIVYITVSQEHRGQIIGKGGSRIKVGRALLKRRFGCDIRVSSR
ncbi:MAG: NusA-like transcription termination signal-binding factor [Candidatus Anstonellales archaeon]